jgi:hypothetical protein
MEILALLIHLPSDRTSHMPWRAALISANAPQHSIEDTDSHFYVCDGASPTSAQLGTRHGAANEPERSRRAPKKIISLKNSYKKTRLGTLLRVSFMPRQQDHDAFDLEFICEEMPYWGSLTHARSARFGFCCHANSLSETAVGPAGRGRH